MAPKSRNWTLIKLGVISGPIEHVRIRLQTQPHGAARLYDGPVDCVRKLLSADGLAKGLYRGEAVTILREAQAYGVWFLTFEYLMNAESRPRAEIPSWKIALYGGLAGEALWLASYPLDVVKSKMQTDNLGDERVYKTMRDCFAKTWQKEGMRGFWKGLGPTCLRAMPVSAGTFFVYVPPPLSLCVDFSGVVLTAGGQGRNGHEGNEISRCGWEGPSWMYPSFYLLCRWFSVGGAISIPLCLWESIDCSP